MPLFITGKSIRPKPHKVHLNYIFKLSENLLNIFLLFENFNIPSIFHLNNASNVSANIAHGALYSGVL